MSKGTEAVLAQIEALPAEEQRELWREFTRRMQRSGKSAGDDPVEVYGEPLSDEDIEESARVTFPMLDEEGEGAKAR